MAGILIPFIDFARMYISPAGIAVVVALLSKNGYRWLVNSTGCSLLIAGHIHIHAGPPIAKTKDT